MDNLRPIRFPHTAYVCVGDVLLGKEDKVLRRAGLASILQEVVAIEEKIDGTNLGMWFDEDGLLRLLNKDTVVTSTSDGQFCLLHEWLALHEPILREILHDRFALFGEWCYARHTLPYDDLPDWFLGYDVYDRIAERFLSVTRRDELLAKLQIATVPHLFSGRLQSIHQLTNFIAKSRYGSAYMEGVYLRIDKGDHLRLRAKFVRSGFRQVDKEHWKTVPITANRLAIPESAGGRIE